MSHLTRGAWIEIILIVNLNVPKSGRTSHEVRGLKYDNLAANIEAFLSHLTRGAWIEMENGQKTSEALMVAPHTRCVD